MNILLVQTAFLGDVVLSTPLIANLKQLYPAANLWVMTTPLGKEILENDPRLAGIISFDKRGAEAGISGLVSKAKELTSHNFQRVYSLHKSWRTALTLWLARIPVRIGFRQSKLHFLYTEARTRSDASHEVLRNLSLIAPECSEMIDDSLSLYVSQQTSSEKTPYIAVFPGSAWYTKQWSVEGYTAVVKNLLSKGKTVLLLGSKAEKDLCESISQNSGARVLAGTTTLGETMVLVKNACAVIANDSMALHLASAFKIPTVAIFCATSPSFGFGPWKNRSIIVEKSGLSCKPCARHGGAVCPVGTEACMKEIPPQVVIDAVEKMVWVS